jgi:hypothetical protein
MHERPPECDHCPKPIQTRLCVYGEHDYEEWVCCKDCPRLCALTPQSPTFEPALSPQQELDHPPEVRRFLLSKGILKEVAGLSLSEHPKDHNEAPSALSLLVGLRRELELALSQERYEDAAAIRDVLKQLEGSQEEG